MQIDGKEVEETLTEFYFLTPDYEELECQAKARKGKASFRVNSQGARRGLEWQMSPSIKMEKQEKGHKVYEELYFKGGERH